jgi:hypothetical protein
MHEPDSTSTKLSAFFSAPGNAQLPAWAAVYCALASAVQFLIVSVPIDADTAYHAAVGRLLSEHGILRSFPWTPFSWLSDHYADKELLFHLLFAPLSGLGWITASKIVGAFLGATLLFVIFLVLRAEKVRFAGLWALLPLVTSDVFLYRFALVRPHLMSISLAIILLWAALRGWYLLLAAVSALYPWSYVAFWQLPLILLCIVEAARFLSGERVQWKPAAVSAAGIVVGWALHPNALNLLKFNWIHMVDVLLVNAWQSKEGIELGLEFLPFTAMQWVRWLFAAAAMTVMGLIFGWRERKQDAGPLAFAFSAVVFGLLAARTARFAEYFIPFAALTMARASKAVPWRGFVIAVFAVSLLYTSKPLTETAQGLGAKREVMPAQLASWLQQRIPAGSQVFTTEWGHTGTLMLALPDRKFIVALDPTLFLVRDPELYRLWYELPRNPRPGMAETIRKRFGARFVVGLLDERFVNFYFQLSSEPGVKALLLSDDNWVVFDLGGPST